MSILLAMCLLRPADTSSLLQRSHLGKQRINFHRDRFVVFSFVIKMGVPFKARLLKDVLFCRLAVRSGVNFEQVLFPNLWAPSCER